MSGNQPNQQTMNLSIRDLIFINSSAFNILLPILIVLFIRYIPQANHIVFSQLLVVDPVSTSGLVILYTVFTMFIYYSQEEKYLYSSNKLDLSIIYQKVNLFVNFIPILIWLGTLLFNEWRNHTLSIVFTLLFGLSMIALIYSEKKYKILVHSSISYIAYLVTLTLLIEGANLFNDFADGQYGILIPTILYTLLLFILIGCIVMIDSKRFALKFSVVFASIIILITLLLSYYGFWKIYTPANILLLYMIVIRIILFLISRSIIIVRDWIPFGSGSLINKLNSPDDLPQSMEEKKQYSKMIITERTLVICMTLLFLFVLLKNSTRDQHDIQTLNLSNKRITFNDYVSNWLNQDLSKDPIFLITGQGGGSRAGSVFFQALSELDPILKNNLLAINTISGSGTGAQFYLSAKYSIGNQYELIFKDPSSKAKANSILYQKDYISSALFKILFSDYFRSKFVRKGSSHSRNTALMTQEMLSYQQLIDSFKLQNFQSDTIDLLNSSWGDIYDSVKISSRKFPLFFPTSYNIQHAVKALSSPVRLPFKKMSPFFDILDSIGSKRNLKIIQSVALNQLFPIMSASATLDTFNYMDGGVYDNLGFETLFDVYKITTTLRDSLAPDRRIILISIENGGYEPDIKKGKLTDFSAVGGAGSNSIFSSVPIEHKQEGLRSLSCQDTFFQLRIYIDSAKAQPSFENMFKYLPNKDEVVMSRYLTQREIDTIANRSNLKVREFKQELDSFLLRAPNTLNKDCYVFPKVPPKEQVNTKKIKPRTLN